jgi:3-phosphoglycerate kinase
LPACIPTAFLPLLLLALTLVPLLLLLLLFTTCCYGLDIGPNTCKRFAAAIARCNTIFWNGPMGRFEVLGFARGTLAMAQEVGKATERGCTTILGGELSVSVQGTAIR